MGAWMFVNPFAEIAACFKDVDGSPFVSAQLTWPGTPTRDAGGTIIGSSPGETVECCAQFDMATQAMRAAEDYRQTDVSIIVLRDGLTREVDTQAKLVVASGLRAGTWQILTAEIDPDGVGYVCRGRKCP